MKRDFVLLSILLIGCAQSLRNPASPPILTTVQQRDQHIGQLVTVRGEITNTKQATILGIDVESSNPDLRGQLAQATGILQSYGVSAEELRNAQMNGVIPNRGPGTFYRLKAVNSDYEAQVQRLSP